jgi:hypothetical protein
MSKCQNCGTDFETGKEPWLVRKEFCAKHDMTYPAGSVCPTCKANEDDAAERTRVATLPIAGIKDDAKKDAKNVQAINDKDDVLRANIVKAIDEARRKVN